MKVTILTDKGEVFIMERKKGECPINDNSTFPKWYFDILEKNKICFVVHLLECGCIENIYVENKRVKDFNFWPCKNCEFVKGRFKK